MSVWDRFPPDREWRVRRDASGYWAVEHQGRVVGLYRTAEEATGRALEAAALRCQGEEAVLPTVPPDPPGPPLEVGPLEGMLEGMLDPVAGPLERWKREKRARRMRYLHRGKP